jgi:hypothetical protein
LVVNGKGQNAHVCQEDINPEGQDQGHKDHSPDDPLLYPEEKQLKSDQFKSTMTSSTQQSKGTE